MAHIGPFASEAHAAMRGLPPFKGSTGGRAGCGRLKAQRAAGPGAAGPALAGLDAVGGG
ncbi:hypothetical protein GCM10027038_08050 [Arthrobacter bambusae]